MEIREDQWIMWNFRMKIHYDNNEKFNLSYILTKSN